MISILSDVVVGDIEGSLSGEVVSIGKERGPMDLGEVKVGLPKRNGARRIGASATIEQVGGMLVNGLEIADSELEEREEVVSLFGITHTLSLLDIVDPDVSATVVPVGFSLIL